MLSFSSQSWKATKVARPKHTFNPLPRPVSLHVHLVISLKKKKGPSLQPPDAESCAHPENSGLSADKVKGILDGGADVNEANDRGWTALMYAAKVRKADLAEMLLERGADPDMADGFGNTALHHASNYGAGPDESPIQTMLLKRREGKTVDVKNKAGMTPLHWAAKSGHIGTASALLAAGADPNAQTLEGSSPLLEACSGGYDVKGKGR